MNDLDTMTCKACGGSGGFDLYYNDYDVRSERCESCDGTGEVDDE